MDIKNIKSKIFNIGNFNDFNTLALQIFHYQYHHNAVYHKFIDLLPVNINNITSCLDIPCLPVEFFKSYDIRCLSDSPELIFKSSGTTSSTPGRHYIFSKALYEESLLNGFSIFFGRPENYMIFALVPDYISVPESSLAFMLDFLIRKSAAVESGFYLNRDSELIPLLNSSPGRKKILFGTTYALMDFSEKYQLDLNDTIVIETGGMKGRRKEITREEMHLALRKKLNVNKIYSEYSMCELMSQAYSVEKGLYTSPPWMKIRIREINDPFTHSGSGKSGGINIIDLANLYTCSFISTKDIGILHDDGSFEVLGRFDYSDIRGCSLLS